jgi:hypothetical protein
VAQCPFVWVEEPIWRAVSLARAWRDSGTPPIFGGAFDQTASFLEAARLVWAEDDRWKAEHELRALKRSS